MFIMALSRRVDFLYLYKGNEDLFSVPQCATCPCWLTLLFVSLVSSTKVTWYQGDLVYSWFMLVLGYK